jgi:hypothetical protein
MVALDGAPLTASQRLARTTEECGSSAARRALRVRRPVGKTSERNGQNAAIAANAAGRGQGGFGLTIPGGGPYNLVHTARRPLTARLRASEAPHLCVEQGLREVVGG